MPTEQLVQLERVGSQQTIRIPREFELKSDEALIRKEGNRLIIEPVQPSSLLALLAALEPVEDEFPDVDIDLLPLDQVLL
ncbi:MAG: AbrB/MazE/SpoVT family DNA-binding domain-containing protein [Caldilineaceae bacterium]|nr:AbrB/MazE/SpoVT family DNA-binding domain-containing protein [Caldilineaceae bacterium]